MISVDDTIVLNITIEDIKNSIKKVLSQDFNKRDNLRSRHSNVQFDCLIRGYIGEIGIIKWFQEYGITFDEANYIEDSSGNIDIDLLYKYGTNKQKTLEIKTSLIPDNFVKNIKNTDTTSKISTCIEHFDIKLIKRNNENIEDLKGDIHIQIYYGDLRQKKDKFLKDLLINVQSHNKTIDEALTEFIDNIYKSTYSQSYLNRTYFVGWIDKETLVKQINQKEEKNKVWTYQKRDFWTCKIKSEAKKPIDLIAYIENLQ